LNLETDKTAAFAEQKINLATRKLQGSLPSLVMELELINATSIDEDVRNEVIKIVRGSEESLREQLRTKAECQMKTRSTSNLLQFKFTAEQQVDCLIEQATDKHILGKTFWGWESWC